MGRPNPVLDIWVWHPWLGRPEVAALHDAGHRISVVGRQGGVLGISPGAEPQRAAPDLILHPAAHAWHDEMWDANLLDVALRAARKRRKAHK